MSLQAFKERRKREWEQTRKIGSYVGPISGAVAIFSFIILFFEGLNPFKTTQEATMASVSLNCFYFSLAILILTVITVELIHMGLQSADEDDYKQIIKADRHQHQSKLQRYANHVDTTGCF